MKQLSIGVTRLLDTFLAATKKALKLLYCGRFTSNGSYFSFDVFGVYTWETISVGNNVILVYRPVLIASQSHIEIGNNVMFGPQATIRGGKHRTDLIGRTMFSVKPKEKRPADDPAL